MNVTSEDIRKAVEVLKKNERKPTMAKCSCCERMVAVYEMQAAPGVTQEQIDALLPILCEDHKEQS